MAILRVCLLVLLIKVVSDNSGLKKKRIQCAFESMHKMCFLSPKMLLTIYLFIFCFPCLVLKIFFTVRSAFTGS